MHLLIKNTRILNEQVSPNFLDILIDPSGQIVQISQNIKHSDAEIWDVEGAWASPGWLDFGTHLADPGFEHREDLDTAARAAATGGFTAIAAMPNTKPAVHSKSEILYLKNHAAQLPVQIFPIGAISIDTAGKDLAELIDMHHAGAVAFSDGDHPVQDAGLLLRAMQYLRAIQGLVINQPHHHTIAAGGQMHEGLNSTMLGMKGIPALAEIVMIQRDLSLLEYAESKLHIHLVSTRKGVELIRAAKLAGTPVTASVGIANLCFTDAALLGENPAPLAPAAAFDSNWKLLPPLRSEDDRQALLEALADGTIDVICSNHCPWDDEMKNLEFPYAAFGMIGLETLFSLYASFLKNELDLATFFDKICTQPRKILGIPQPKIEVGAYAEITFFDPNRETTYSPNRIQSKSKNTPLLNCTFQGKVLGTINGKNWIKNDPN